MPTIHWSGPLVTDAVKENVRTGLQEAFTRLEDVIAKLKKSGKATDIKKYLEGKGWVFTKKMTSVGTIEQACSTFAATFKCISDTMRHGRYELSYDGTTKHFAETTPDKQHGRQPAARTVEMTLTFLYHKSDLDVRAGVMIHETSHAVWNTSDAVYGDDDARSTFTHYLAVNRTADALEYLSADIYAM